MTAFRQSCVNRWLVGYILKRHRGVVETIRNERGVVETIRNEAFERVAATSAKMFKEKPAEAPLRGVG